MFFGGDIFRPPSKRPHYIRLHLRKSFGMRDGGVDVEKYEEPRIPARKFGNSPMGGFPMSWPQIQNSYPHTHKQTYTHPTTHTKAPYIPK